MDLESYRSTYNKDDSTPGWDAINLSLEKIYGPVEPLTHWATVIKYMLGGPDPLDGISVYASDAGGRKHWHFISYGFSSLYYDEDSVGKAHSKYGFELSFRLLAQEGWTVEKDSSWVSSMMQNIARYIFSSGKWFEPYHWMPAKGPIKLNDDTLIHGVIFVSDPELPAIATPHGEVQFLQMVGVTDAEIKAVMDKTATPEEIIGRLQEKDPYFVCDLGRKDPYGLTTS